jgi:hypothetical protein
MTTDRKDRDTRVGADDDTPAAGAPEAEATDRPRDEAVERRSHLLPEEERAGSADPEAEAKAILEESEHRQRDRSGTATEHRRSPDVVEPLD